MIIFSKYIVPKGYMGITVFPFVILRHKFLKKDKVLVNHEKIHLKQQLELFIILFYLWYVIEFLYRITIYKNWQDAYKNISFEREAYYNEKNLSYLKQRRLYTFVKYL